MDNEIYTEYEKAVIEARQEANKLAREANSLLAKNITVGEIEFNMNWFMKKAELVKYDETQGKFVPVDPHYNLHTPTMEFVTPEELKRRDAENVKRLQEISGK